MLKIGELAARSGVTVRTLHHYDSIGLLRPSTRSDSGYRLYGAADIARLHHILALRKLGLALPEIGSCLSSPDFSLTDIVARQIASLERQIAEAGALHARLTQLQATLSAGEQPELGDWLSTLELMHMYEQYFNQQELARLSLYDAPPEVEREWQDLVARLAAAMADGVQPADPRALALSAEWMTKLVRDTGGDPRLMQKLDTMHKAEASVQRETGITLEMIAYIGAAAWARRLAVYRRYLDDAEYAFLEANCALADPYWIPLLADVREAMEAGLPPDHPDVQALARRWLALF
ncbi:MAG TPA: MerR family transcriptional regulator, partial [Burkholderiaceae bacterium]